MEVTLIAVKFQLAMLCNGAAYIHAGCTAAFVTGCLCRAVHDNRMLRLPLMAAMHMIHPPAETPEMTRNLVHRSKLRLTRTQGYVGSRPAVSSPPFQSYNRSLSTSFAAPPETLTPSRMPPCTAVGSPTPSGIASCGTTAAAEPKVVVATFRIVTNFECLDLPVLEDDAAATAAACL